MLNKATSDAQRKAGLAVSSVDGFKKTVVKKYDPNVMSKAQWRWIWAISRVILQNFVAAVKVRLERYEREKNSGTCKLLSVIGYWLLVTGYWLPAYLITKSLII